MKGLRIRPERRGLRASLFDLEADIMEVVWARGWDWFSVADVLEELRRRRDIAYTTVMTTVSRLYDKRMLRRRRDGRRYVYAPRMSREEFEREAARRVFDSLPSAGREAALALLVDRVASGDAAELEELARLIARKKRELGR
ncbi:MAG TPA: BlaI/MecI/CopY family transcriptional regulator [Polyangiaceae bacterium]|jgi:predicted transcriptional regulator|nr:BlaI/MecI/CopY family transcriptional regulator [Polyangiaceae bacterium]